MRLIQVVPLMPPQVEGVGAYALQLGRALHERGGWRVHYLVGDPSWVPGAREDQDAEVSVVGDRSAHGFHEGLERLAPSEDDGCAVLLHYAGYGYHRRGCPAWLASGAERWLAASPARRLVTFFHEVSASGPPWRSSFWLAPLQRRIAGRLARSSTATATSLPLYADVLGRLYHGARPLVLPVVSNVGEPEALPPLANRSRRVVVFGGPGNRRRVWSAHLPQLESACRSLELEEVVDVGPVDPSGPEAPDRLGPVPVRRRGVLPAREVSALLLDCVAGFLSYPPDFLPKSGVFAAYCAHRTATICAWGAGVEIETPSPLQGLYIDGGQSLDLAGAQAAADRALGWYRGHSVDRQAEILHHLLAHSELRRGSGSEDLPR